MFWYNLPYTYIDLGNRHNLLSDLLILQWHFALFNIFLQSLYNIYNIYNE